MKNSKYFDHHPACCELCEKGTVAADKTSVVCPIKGVVDLSFGCKKFVYDPLKRRPAKKKTIRQFTKEDFEL